MRLIHTLSLVLAAATLAGCARSDRGVVSPAHTTPVGAAAVTVTVEDVGGYALPTFAHLGQLYVEGQQDQAYAIRLTNNSPARVEAVVTVDGRDVVSGQLGNYKKQRGYIIEPFGSIRVDGFRQSLSHVAEFRFSDVAASYGARMGTPQHAGVIGVAVFYEKESRNKKTGPIAVGPGPAPEPEPFPAERSRRDKRGADVATSSPAQEESPSAPPADADFGAVEAEAPMADGADDAAPTSAARASEGGGFAPPPEPVNQLGTEYGDSVASSVHEVEFKRRKKRKPDELFAIRYDSAAGLRARGVPLDGGAGPYAAPDSAFPGSR